MHIIGNSRQNDSESKAQPGTRKQRLIAGKRTSAKSWYASCDRMSCSFRKFICSFSIASRTYTQGERLGHSSGRSKARVQDPLGAILGPKP